MSANGRGMSGALRRSAVVVFGILWLTGCLWLVLHGFFSQKTAFGDLPNPWQPSVIQVHGWAAVAGLFLLGWISSGHIVDRWSLYRSRPSGPLLAALALLLVLSGYALYYTTDHLHDAAAVIHEVLGVAGILFAIVHWRTNGISRRKGQ